MVIFSVSFLPQLFSQASFRLKAFSEIVRLLLAAASINWLTDSHLGHTQMSALSVVSVPCKEDVRQGKHPLWYNKCVLMNAYMQLSSGSMISFTITWEFRKILQNISRRVVGNIRIAISPVVFSQLSFRLKDFLEIVRLLLSAASLNWLTDSHLEHTYTSLTK